MRISRKIEEAVDEAKECLDLKGLGWLLNEVNLHQLDSDGGIGGEYVYTPSKNSTDMYLEPKSDELELSTVLLHECGHRLYVEEFNNKEKGEVKNYYKKLRKRYSLPRVSNMLKELMGEKIESFGHVMEIQRPKKKKHIWIFELDSGDEVEVDGLESLRFFYYRHAPSITNNQLKAFPTSYSYIDPIEWFAEIFAFWCEDDVCANHAKLMKKLTKPYARRTI